MDQVKEIFSDFMQALDSSHFGFFNLSLGDKGIVDIFWFVINVTFTALVLLLGAIIIGILGTYLWRYLYHSTRHLAVGNIVWSEVIYEGVISDNDWVNSIGQMDNMANLMKNRNTGMNFGFQFDRPRYLIAIRLNPDDEQLHMYIGINEKAYDENILSSWASGANCSIEPIDFADIGFVPRAPMGLMREDYDTANFTDAPNNSTVGRVVKNLQSSATMQTGGTVVISYEPMTKKEERTTVTRINAENYERGGEASKLDMTARNANIFTSKSPCRGVVVAFSDDGDYGTSESLLNTVRGGIPSLGVRSSAARYEQFHRRAGMLTILPSILMMLLGVFKFVPLWLPLIFVVLSVLTIIGVPSLSSLWISKASAKEMNPPIPPYLRFSPRRMLDRYFHGLRRRNHGSKYISEPSMREIIPLYQTSLMQFASMPKDGARNVSSFAIPQVPMSSSVNQDIAESMHTREVALLGTSVKTFAPVMFTAADLNNGIAMAGDRGSGKTNSLQVLYTGVSHLSKTLDKYQFTPFWLETKSDDLRELVTNIKDYQPQVVFVHDQKRDTRIAFEGPRYADGAEMETVKKNISTMVTSMEKLWGNGGIGPRSKQVAQSAMTLAMLLNSKELKFLGLAERLVNPQRPNVMALVNLLIGADPTITMVEPPRRAQPGREAPQGVLERLAAKYRSIALSAEAQAKVSAAHGGRELARVMEMVPAFDQLINLYQTQDAIKPLQNKIPVLLKSEGLWETVTPDGSPRREVPITSFLDYGAPVVVDLTERYSTLSDEEKIQFSMLFHYMLWMGIKEHCAGWARQNKFVPIFVDELSYITGRRDSESTLGGIVSEVLDIGRSYGASHAVGFQNYNQLPPAAVATMRGMTSKLYYTLNNSEDRKIVLEQIGDRTRYTMEAIAAMPQGYCIADLSIGKRKRSPFTLKVPYFPTYSEALKSSGDVLAAFDEVVESEKEKIAQDKKMKVSQDDLLYSTQDSSDGGDLAYDVPDSASSDSYDHDAPATPYDDGFDDLAASGGGYSDNLDWLE